MRGNCARLDYFRVSDRIHCARGSSDISEAAKKQLRTIFVLLFMALILGFIAWSITVLVSAHKPKNLGFAFIENDCLVLDVIAFIFLCQVIVMAILETWLLAETYRVVARERQARQGGFVTHALHKERCTYAVISTFFALSYIGRFILNKYGNQCSSELW